jgi:hypothetical protein
VNEYETEKRIVMIYRRLHDSLDSMGIMLCDMKWYESGIDRWVEDEDRYERAAKIAREFKIWKE